jgi:hypothetical protein
MWSLFMLKSAAQRRNRLVDDWFRALEMQSGLRERLAVLERAMERQSLPPWALRDLADTAQALGRVSEVVAQLDARRKGQL